MLTTDQAQNDIFYSSAVIEHIVPKDKQFAFRQWHQTLVSSIQQSEGYVRVISAFTDLETSANRRLGTRPSRVSAIEAATCLRAV